MSSLKHYIILILLLFDENNGIDIDLQTCIDHFDVHRDKIIRTQDSQKMGAKYLNEIDLGNREECLRLCCETDGCDVFVFEEKNSGGCYLFRCGPPEDFKCKFTHHVNYSSAVLAINRHLSELESEMRLTKHEQDLNKLRQTDEHRMSTSRVLATSRPTKPTTTSITTTTQLITTVRPDNRETMPEMLEKETSKCRHSQFECRTTKECIAIYNACDGIPQCADGSDEAPDLGCPNEATTITPLHPPPQTNREIYQVPPPLPPPQPDFIRPENHGVISPQRPVWMPHQSNQMPTSNGQLPPYAIDDDQSHIFNHKLNGIRVQDGSDLPNPIQYSESANYPGKYYPESNYRRPDNWGSDDYNSRFKSHPNWPNTYLPDQQKSIVYPPNYHRTTIPDSHPFDPDTGKHEQEKMVNELKISKENADKINEKKVKIEKHKHYAAVVAAYSSDNSDLQDGIAETPGGALLSLTLGLIITFIVALILGCRLKVRRRLRKNGKGYAHDADYLVNGMYL